MGIKNRLTDNGRAAASAAGSNVGNGVPQLWGAAPSGHGTSL